MENVKLLPLLLSASLSLVPLNGITASAEDTAYSFNIAFIDEESEEYVGNVDAKLIQRAIEWTDEEHYSFVGDGNIVCEWNSSDENSFITPAFTDNWQDYVYTVIVDDLPDGYLYNSGNNVDYGISGYLDGEVKVTIKLNEGEVPENKTPLEGTYSLKLNVMDIVRNEKVAGLECELFNMQSGEVVAAWNTSETEEMYVENLQYAFDKPDSYNGNITYAIRITNLPENYRFFYGKNRDKYGVSGFGLEEFANGTDISCTVYLEDTSEDAPKYTYVTAPQGNTTTVTTTTTVTDDVVATTLSDTESQSTTSTTVTEPVDLNTIPLSGTYTLKLNVMDIVRNEKIAGLDCELFNIQSGEVVATWNTSETEEMYVENLQYSFDKVDSYNGNITYAIRITNLPENYRFFYGKSRDQYGVSGFGLEEFANGTDISCTVYLEDTSEDAPKYTYVTTPQESTTTTTATAAEGRSEELPQTGYSGIYNVVVGLAAVLTISGIALIAKSKKENE